MCKRVTSLNKPKHVDKSSNTIPEEQPGTKALPTVEKDKEEEETSGGTKFHNKDHRIIEACGDRVGLVNINSHNQRRIIAVSNQNRTTVYTSSS
jgi:hypothetical protein